jgi:penicillin-binding protein-related factor A (putative recombinase)
MPILNFKYIGLLFFLSLLPFFVKAAKTDTITFYNGEHIRCEIKNLQTGKLNVKTVNMGTVSI